MKLLLLSFVLVNSLLSFDYKLQPKEVSSEIHCFFGLPEVMDKRNNGNMSNSCFVNMGTSYLVIDSGPTYQYAAQAYEAMKKIKNLPVSYVVNTHVHDDHWLGNGFYKEHDAKIIGPSIFANLPKEEMTRMQRRISAEAFHGTTQEYPTILITDREEIDIDGKIVIIKSVNHKAHTKNDLFVYIPSKKALFAGDLVFNERLPSLRDGNINGWIAALQEIKMMDVDYIIGGHGDVVSKKSVDFTYNYLMQLKKEVLQRLDDGEDIGDVVNEVVMPEYKEIPFYDSIHRQNVETAYRTLEWESE
ncbi:MBL fold metallo-hydrolase [Sulfurimonas paralvinellae]|uniref:MBL fold metallo-hydrolase n=1 Tax=Sulfurimonas paralvinellae TaxID=317658 RepID=A0A7M1B794_9BACT|nr:MBL fold metallo-hydrolase [Sulfurimonas paralvinellae]QOP45515.1 MBL fold metallo-hydrolase [Sulfurimonas paralvinellae]